MELPILCGSSKVNNGIVCAQIWILPRVYGEVVLMQQVWWLWGPQRWKQYHYCWHRLLTEHYLLPLQSSQWVSWEFAAGEVFTLSACLWWSAGQLKAGGVNWLINGVCGITGEKGCYSWDFITVLYLISASECSNWS